jgi:hypothetical protein
VELVGVAIDGVELGVCTSVQEQQIPPGNRLIRDPVERKATCCFRSLTPKIGFWEA